MRDIIIGKGEIGSSLFKTYPVGECATHDITYGKAINYGCIRILNICFPYDKNFIKEVKKYQEFYKPEYTVIHSTVPVGTSRKCKAVHSPVVGIHPHLEESLLTFKKFFGGPGASDVADIFRKMGYNVYVTDRAESTELMKVLCTTVYGLNIEFTKEVKRLCDSHNVPFEIFTIWNENYNSGYERLGYPEYHRYNLVPLMKEIGGHCVTNNYKLLESKFIDFLEGIK